ncbi:hypothetical protein H0H81_007567 [Sphagnurus paluster]|uniref:Sphingomyelin phosphodiesterase n=1 Tax=Sphagnurus paluster TaxID=117069 RepID=A0A9P7GM01_9AGAR|nr:hypothetical protein H0H81_007567 [Sphagnurus paluster]
MAGFRVLLALLLCVCAAYGSIITDLLDAIERAVDCGTCHAALVPLQGISYLGDSAFSNTVIALCKAVKLQDADVCAGVLGQQGPLLAHDLRSISAFGQTATKLCDSVFGLCQPPAINKYSVPFPKPPPANPKVFKSQGRPPIQVSHFSDVHIDREYAPGSDLNCTKPICCRNYADSAKPPKVPARPMGEHHCDTTTGLVQSMLRTVNSNPKNAFSIFTGDVVEASVWLVNKTGVTNDLKLFNNEMNTLLVNAPVYPAVGNHEIAPINAFPRNTSSDAHFADWVFDIQGKAWTKWITPAGVNQFNHYSGSYSVVHPRSNLRIISINTVYWYKANFWLYDSDKLQPDPNGILAFTVQELQAAEDAGQRAWIVAHMPPGGRDALQDQSNYFDQIVQRYKNTIAGQFYGHSHMDQFGIAYSDYTRRSAETAVSVAMIAPALTPRGKHHFCTPISRVPRFLYYAYQLPRADGNSAFKVYDVDPDTYEIMDAKVYRSNLDSPTFQTSPTWELYYSARETYGPLVGVQPSEALGPAFWHRVTEAFARNDTAFQQYNTFLNAGYGVTPCDGACKNATICELRALRAQDNCVRPESRCAGCFAYVAKPGLHFRKRDGESADVHDLPGDCEGAGLGSIFAELPLRVADQSPAERAELERVMEEALAASQPSA